MDNYHNAAACSSASQSWPPVPTFVPTYAPSSHMLPPATSFIPYPGLPSNQSFLPTSTFTHPQRNLTMPYYASQQSVNYNDNQTNAVAHYGTGPTEAAALAVVHTVTRSVIAINENGGMPQLVNHQSAVLSYNNAQDKIAADYTEEEIIAMAVEAMQPLLTKEPTLTIPANPDDFPGELDFQCFLNSDESKKSFSYSQLLGKVFLNTKKILPVQFSWKTNASKMRVRACMMFQDANSRDKPVQRCHAHQASDLEENPHIEPVVLKFVFRTNQSNSIYDENKYNGLLSILTPAGLPNPGREHFQVDYEFVCMTSCVTGINKRATLLVFTLENEDGQVFGRRSLPIQICSRPKRDMEKEEDRQSSRANGKVNKAKKSDKPAPYTLPRPRDVSGSPQSTTSVIQPSASLPQPSTSLPRPSASFPQRTIGSLPQPTKPSPTLPNNGEDESSLDLSLQVVGRDLYYDVLNFTYSMLLKEAFENNNFDRHREALSDLAQKIKDHEKLLSSTSTQ